MEKDFTADVWYRNSPGVAEIHFKYVNTLPPAFYTL